jgi:hypothetical protein
MTTVPQHPLNDSTVPQEDDYEVQSYQDDVSTHGNDPVSDHFGDDPTKELQVPAERFKEELSRYDDENPSDDQEGEADDMREQVEDLSEDENLDKSN